MKIVILAGKDDFSKFYINFIKKNYDVSLIILEDKPNKFKFMKNRLKKLGFIKLISQIVFQLFIPRILYYRSKKYIEQLKNSNNFDSGGFEYFDVDSINSNLVIDKLKEVNPNLVLVQGTRIIKKEILDSVKVPFINIHAGITPKYRGVHGGYWALALGENNLCGVTVHLVDEGIDTGNILAQSLIDINVNDNFITYPYKQLANGLTLLKIIIDKYKDIGELKTIKPMVLDSRLFYHPTFYEYIYYFIKRKAL